MTRHTDWWSRSAGLWTAVARPDEVMGIQGGSAAVEAEIEKVRDGGRVAASAS